MISQIEPGRIWFEVDAGWLGCDRDLLTGGRFRPLRAFCAGLSRFS